MDIQLVLHVKCVLDFQAKTRGSCVSGCPRMQQFSVGRLLGQQSRECFGCQQGCEPPSLLLLGALSVPGSLGVQIVK